MLTRLIFSVFIVYLLVMIVDLPVGVVAIIAVKVPI